MADTDRSLYRQISELLELIRQYGPEPVAARNRESRRGASFWRRLYRQYSAPATIPTTPAAAIAVTRCAIERTGTELVSLLEYDAFILEAGKESGLPSNRNSSN